MRSIREHFAAIAPSRARYSEDPHVLARALRPAKNPALASMISSIPITSSLRRTPPSNPAPCPGRCSSRICCALDDPALPYATSAISHESAACAGETGGRSSFLHRRRPWRARAGGNGWGFAARACRRDLDRRAARRDTRCRGHNIASTQQVVSATSSLTGASLPSTDRSGSVPIDRKLEHLSRPRADARRCPDPSGVGEISATGKRASHRRGQLIEKTAQMGGG